ncbi:hypothetical protein GPECTOR_5g447 [Gonium pectorale]|uniref:FCP1 homology domain-containing protein n=1 Tax=Gonium pectorale TaxID=33097 RepID=A0A150GWV9_GONPE|nr:hypothetical protein GPECTOR_5g447 [Gonium pectorale]|eukprot:KXZ54367.1 hypothetical protein GPECTOR_5g447 [Gonium pectorale]
MGRVPAARSPAGSIGAGGEHSPASAHGGRAGPSSVAVVPVRSSHPHGLQCTQLHAIDLNVVEGVAADEDEVQEPTRGAGEGERLSGEAGSAGLHGGQGADPAGAGADGHRRRGRQRDSTSSGEDLRALGERLSSSEEGAGEGETEAEEGTEGDDDEFPDANDENAPVGGYGAARAGAGGSQQRHQAHRRGSGTGEHRAAATGQQQQGDAVLVASAPRNQTVGTSGTAMPPAAQPAAAEAEEAGGDDDELFMEFDPLLFIKQLPPLESCVPPNRPTLLPPQRPARSAAGAASGRRKTLVLDLDETLVHSSLEPVARADFSFPVSFNGAEHIVHVRQRPHLRDFMVRVSQLFEVVVFTASQRIYAERLLDILDPGQALVRHRIYRDSCVVVDGNYLKDLSVLGRELAHTIIVDNSPQAFGFQVDNGIPIESWYDDDADDELLRLLPFLELLAAPDVDDVRPRIRQQFRLQELIDRA